jgi:hypothetical protein
MTSEEYDDHFTFKGKHRTEFFRQFVQRMRIDRKAGGAHWPSPLGRWKSEGEYWRRTFSHPWKPFVSHIRGLRAKDLDFDAKISLGYVSIQCVKKGRFWRIWGFDRNTA